MKRILDWITSIKCALYILCSNSQRKHIFRWIRSLRVDYLTEMNQPWLVFDAIDFLDKMDLQRKKIFEYGSGGSTLYWLSRGSIVISIEHNNTWYKTIANIVKDNKNIKYSYIGPEPCPYNLTPDDAADPDKYSSSDYTDNYYYKQYVCSIDKYESEYFDLVLIDGRARPSCIKHSINKVKTGGFLIIDNSERGYYFEKTNMLLNRFRLIQFVGIGPSLKAPWKTDIYVKQN